MPRQCAGVMLLADLDPQAGRAVKRLDDARYRLQNALQQTLATERYQRWVAIILLALIFKSPRAV